MPTKTYYKDESFDPIYNTVNKRFYFKSRMLPGTLLALGFLVLGTQVVYPLVYLETHDEANKQVKSSVLGLATGFSEFEFRELDAEDGNKNSAEELPKFFTITIPKLGIKDAQVETNSPTLNPDKSLGHYKGSGLPGQVGNSFIYGHSVLPWFYNPKNYKTIFSTLDQLETGDSILVNYNGKDYKYIVEGK
ncbi:sortase [candidate division WWE3 bacterium]|uniref:Sortase n=1 Tax=candidate division WWE3 bacterium TaxID=2053526 RepID=A0A7X9DKC1_UNCKA|nr:sortase [candidate division WWE3 bacterium]